MRRAYGWVTRITGPEVATRNRRARFPATHCDGVLRIASAACTLLARECACREDLTKSNQGALLQPDREARRAGVSSTVLGTEATRWV